MILRKAEVSDASDIAAIHRRARAAGMPWLPVLHTPAQDIGFFTNRVLPVETVQVTIAGQKIAGFSAFHDGWLNHLYIDPDNWRTGIGAALLSHAQTVNSALQLWTFQGNLAARAFYAAAGFKEAEFTDGRANEEKTPDVRLLWS